MFLADCDIVGEQVVGPRFTDRRGLQTTPAQAGKPQAPDSGRPLDGAQAKALLNSVDEILGFASSDSALPIHSHVGRRLVSRDEVTAYLEQHMAEDKDTERLKRSELVLKKFGLVPRGFALEPFLLRLLREQIAGYYDDKTKTVNLLNWVGEQEQRPVLAHELTHALQDQTVDLERWSDSGVHGVAETAAEDQEHLRTDELETARSAVAEGQAMLVFLDYALRGTGKTLADSPDVVEQLLSADAKDDTSPVMAEAPRVLQESLLFPYTDGLRFEAALLKAGGKRAAFAEALARPPNSTYEVMTPPAYLAHGTVPALALPDLPTELAADYAPYDVGVMGALDVRVMAETFDPTADADALAAAWDGGAYYAADRRPGATQGTGGLALLYVSRWKDEEAAETFAKLYTGELKRKYARLEPEVAVKGDDAAASDADCLGRWFRSEEGEVLVARCGRSVVVTEGFARAQAEQLRRETLAVNAPVVRAEGHCEESQVGVGVAGQGLTASLRQAMPANYTLLGRLAMRAIMTKAARDEAH